LVRRPYHDRIASEIRTKARHMAHTGDYGGWVAIESMLRHQLGYPQAKQALKDQAVRGELDGICARRRNDIKIFGD